MATRSRTVFLLESYVPKLDVARGTALAACVRAAIAELQREGLAVGWLQSFALVGEETYVWMVSATDADDVARVARRAGVNFDHVVEVLPDEASGW